MRGRQWKDLHDSGQPLKQGILLSKKTCSKCNETPDEEAVIECMCCHQRFHLPCLLKPIDKSFVKLVAENPSVWWYCLGCVSLKSSESVMSNNNGTNTDGSVSDVVMHNTLMNFKKDILTLVSETMDRKLSALPSLISASNTKRTISEKATSMPSDNAGVPLNSNTVPKTWANVSSSPILQNQRNDMPSLQTAAEIPPKAQKHVLLLEPKDTNNAVLSKEAKKKSLQDINSAISGVNVEFCTFKKSGLVAVGFSDSEAKQRAEQKIKDDATVSSTFKTRLPRKLLPKVTVYGINEVLFDSCEDDREEMKLTLKRDILRRNDCVRQVLESDSDATLEIVMLQKVMPSHSSVSYMAAMKMSSSVRKAIYDNGDRLYVSLKRCKVVDRFHIVQCFHCQEPGHLSKDCPTENATCYYCAGDHRSKECEHKNSEDKKCCSNCLKSSNPEVKRNAKSHTAASHQCPVMQSHILNMKSKTERWQEKNSLV